VHVVEPVAVVPHAPAMRLGLVLFGSALAAIAAGCSCGPSHERMPVTDAGADASVSMRDAFAAADAFVGIDAIAPTDAFVAADTTDAFAADDALVVTDAFVLPDAGPHDAGVPIDGATCNFVGSFRETTGGFVTTLDAGGTWRTLDASGGMASGTYSRSGDTITFGATGGCSATYHFVGNGCDAFMLVFVSSDCGTTGSNLSYVRTS
jgi:hypothetical protein